jgi:hypothetical protein
MKKMEFKVRCVRECLLREGRAFTVRGYNMRSEYVEVDRVGRCFRKNVVEVMSKEDLLKFLTWSGFTTVDEWWKATEFFCAGRRKWLYYVFIRNGVGA